MPDLPEQRFHAERASFVGNDGDDELADFRIAQHLPQHADERHRRGNFAAFAARVEFAKQRVVIRDQRLGPHLARGHVAAQCLAPRAQILDFAAVLGRPIERRFGELIVADRNAEARTKLAEFFLVELLLLVRDVSAFAAFAKAVALDGSREDHGGRALVFDS